MTCTVEMLPCDSCGREVPYFHIRVVTTADGERAFICAECNGEQESGESPESPSPCN